jgi:stage II sporulation protein AA (anti-sigma F factor antagonist)
MKTASEYGHRKLTIKLYGELDHHAAKETIDLISKDIDKYQPKICILDFRGVAFMDSSGIAVMVKAYKRIKELGGELRVLNISKQSKRVFEMSGLEKLISLEEIRA